MSSVQNNRCLKVDQIYQFISILLSFVVCLVFDATGVRPLTLASLSNQHLQKPDNQFGNVWNGYLDFASSRVLVAALFLCEP